MAEQLPIAAWQDAQGGGSFISDRAKNGSPHALWPSFYTVALTPHAPAQSALDEAREDHASAEAHLQACLGQIKDMAVERDELRREVECLKTVMIAAAEEIHGHWDAHCDQEGYGPANLMRRLEQGIPSEYGYTAGAFESLRREVERLTEERDSALASINLLAGERERWSQLAVQHLAEVEALRADRDRLDWLETVPACSIADQEMRAWLWKRPAGVNGIRAAIDTARASTDEGVGK